MNPNKENSAVEDSAIDACSFCGKGAEVVAAIVKKRDGVCICDECLDVAKYEVRRTPEGLINALRAALDLLTEQLVKLATADSIGQPSRWKSPAGEPSAQSNDSTIEPQGAGRAESAADSEERK